MPCYSPHTPNQPIEHQHLAVCGSTNSELMQRVTTKIIDKNQPYLLTAAIQTAGRGQRARTWQSPIGNIYLSLYHPLQVPLSGLLSLVVGFQLTRLPIIQQINNQRRALNLPIIGVKWANDIGYYDIDLGSSKKCSSFNKLAGILIEPVLENNQLIGVIVGIGINIEAAPVLSETTKEGMDYKAVSLTQIIEETRRQSNYQDNHNPTINTNTSCGLPTAKDLYRPVSATILRALNQFIGFTHDPYSLQQFVNDYNKVSVLTGHQVQIMQQSIIDNSKEVDQATEPQGISGKVRGINKDGSLQLSCEDNAQPVNIYTGTIRVISSHEQLVERSNLG